MKNMFAIVNVDKNWGIGFKGQLLCRFKEDMQYFKEKTISQVCVMGRKTLESFTNAAPLNDRLNLVLTSKAKEIKTKYSQYNNIIFFETKEELLEYLKTIKDKSIYIIGGESIYKMFLDSLEKIYVTKVDKEFEHDAVFPNLDENSNFKIEEESEKLYNKEKNIYYRMVTYAAK